MKKLTALLAAAQFAAAMSLVSCSGETPFVGDWTALTPTDVTSRIAGASEASSLMTISFFDSARKSDGDVELTANVAVTRPVEGFVVADGSPCEVSVVSTTKVSGTWSYDVDDQDDLLLALNVAKVDVDVAPDAVTFPDGMPYDVAPAQVDSIRRQAAAWCRREVARYVASDIARYTVIKDVEVSKDGSVLAFEIENPDADLRFRRLDR